MPKEFAWFFRKCTRASETGFCHLIKDNVRNQDTQHTF